MTQDCLTNYVMYIIQYKLFSLRRSEKIGARAGMRSIKESIWALLESNYTKLAPKQWQNKIDLTNKELLLIFASSPLLSNRVFKYPLNYFQFLENKIPLKHHQQISFCAYLSGTQISIENKLLTRIEGMEWMNLPTDKVEWKEQKLNLLNASACRKQGRQASISGKQKRTVR